MSKMSNLDLVLDEMITAGQKMIEAANALKEMFSEKAEPDPKKATKKKDAAEEPATAPAETEAPKTSDPRTVIIQLIENIYLNKKIF